jgi:hypothetical protein
LTGNLHPDSAGALAILGETAEISQKHLLEENPPKITEMSRKMIKKVPLPLFQLTGCVAKARP